MRTRTVYTYKKLRSPHRTRGINEKLLMGSARACREEDIKYLEKPCMRFIYKNNQFSGHNSEAIFGQLCIQMGFTRGIERPRQCTRVHLYCFDLDYEA